MLLFLYDVLAQQFSRTNDKIKNSNVHCMKEYPEGDNNYKVMDILFLNQPPKH